MLRKKVKKEKEETPAIPEESEELKTVTEKLEFFKNLRLTLETEGITRLSDFDVKMRNLESKIVELTS